MYFCWERNTIFRWDHLNSKEERQWAKVLNRESCGKLRKKLVNEAQIIAYENEIIDTYKEIENKVLSIVDEQRGA